MKPSTLRTRIPDALQLAVREIVAKDLRHRKERATIDGTYIRLVANGAEFYLLQDQPDMSYDIAPKKPYTVLDNLEHDWYETLQAAQQHLSVPSLEITFNKCLEMGLNMEKK